jgi:hypothetical protein
MLGASNVRAAPPASASPATNSAFNSRLKAAVSDAAGELGTLEPWQKKIVDEEALPQYQRFIRDYSSTTIQVDREALANFLAFYAKKSLNRETSTALVVLKPEASCAKCLEAAPAIHRLIKARLERRGFTLSFVNPEDLGDPKLDGARLDERALEAAPGRNAAAVLVVRWQAAPVDDLDSAHAEEKRYLMHSLIAVWGAAQPGADVSRELARSQGQVELLDNDSFESPMSRLLTDAFSDLGAKVVKAQTQVAGGDRSEILVEVRGIRDFTHFSKIKAQLRERLKEASSIDERTLMRGKAQFAVNTTRTADQVRAELAGFGAETASAGPAEVPIEWEVK